MIGHVGGLPVEELIAQLLLGAGGMAIGVRVVLHQRIGRRRSLDR